MEAKEQQKQLQLNNEDTVVEEESQQQENDDTTSTTTTTTSWFRATRPGHMCAPYSSSDASVFEIFSFTVIFFLSMIAHDVSLEAASTEFVALNALPYAVTLFQFGFCLLLPLIISFAKGQSLTHDFPTSAVGIVPYLGLSLFVFGSTSLETISVRHVNYYTKAMFKSSKLIPTMLLSALIIPNTSYGWMEYFSASLICLGAAGFYLGGNNESDGSSDNSYTGLLLLTCSMFFDGLVPNIQQNLMKPPQQPSQQLVTATFSTIQLLSGNDNKKELSATSLMVNMNSVGFAGCLIYMLLTGHLIDAIDAALDEPRLFMYLALAGSGLAIALLAYTGLIRKSGSVVAVAVTTLRKVVAVVLSYIFFPNKQFSKVHLFSGALLLFGIFINTYCGNNQQAKNQQHKRRPSDVEPEEMVELTRV